MTRLPVKQQVQYLFGGGESSVGAEENSDICIVLPFESRNHVLHQFLQCASLNCPTLAGLVQTQGGVCLHAQPSLPLTSRLVELHLSERDGIDGSVLCLFSDLLN